jgi:hypothetical protein
MITTLLYTNVQYVYMYIKYRTNFTQTNDANSKCILHVHVHVNMFRTDDQPLPGCTVHVTKINGY